MENYCRVRIMFIKPKSKSRHYKSKNQKNLDKHKHIKLAINDPNVDNIDKKFYTHINEYDNMYE